MGFLRLYLALVVVVSHLGDVPFFPSFDPGMAVFCFFIISGYYAAYALNEVYVGNGSVKRYYLNRIVRLWPIYIVSLLILWPTGLIHQVFFRAMELPLASAAAVVASNILIVGIDVFSHISLTPSGSFIAPFGTADHNGVTYILNLPAWSLSIELLFYAVAPFVVRNAKRSVVLLVCGLLFCVFWKYNKDVFSGLRPDLSYTHFMVYFGLGSSSYWLSKQSGSLPPKAYAALAVVVLLALQAHLPGLPVVYLAVAIAVDRLFLWTKSIEIDGMIANLSYPVYILHIPLSISYRSLINPQPGMLEYYSFCLGGAALIAFTIDHGLSRIRLRIRRGQQILKAVPEKVPEPTRAGAD